MAREHNNWFRLYPTGTKSNRGKFVLRSPSPFSVDHFPRDNQEVTILQHTRQNGQNLVCIKWTEPRLGFNSTYTMWTSVENIDYES